MTCILPMPDLSQFVSPIHHASRLVATFGRRRDAALRARTAEHRLAVRLMAVRLEENWHNSNGADCRTKISCQANGRQAGENWPPPSWEAGHLMGGLAVRLDTSWVSCGRQAGHLMGLGLLDRRSPAARDLLERRQQRERP